MQRTLSSRHGRSSGGGAPNARPNKSGHKAIFPESQSN